MASAQHKHSDIQRVENTLLVWLDTSIDETSNDFKNMMMHLRRVSNSVNTFKTEESCIQFLKEQIKEKMNIVVSDTLGPTFVPCIHNMPQVNAIFIFYNKNLSEEDWTRTWNKTQGFFSDIELLCQSLKETTKICEKNSITFSLVKTDGDATKNLDQLEPLFMYTQLIKEIVLSINFDQKHIDQYFEYCRNAFKGNDIELTNIKEMADGYRLQGAIWWYTKESFLYPMLNRALRLTEISIILKISFFIKDLHQQLKQLHREEFLRSSKNKPFIVYRGLTLSEEDMKKVRETKGGLIAFTSFLSTSKQRDVSVRFALSSLQKNPDVVGVLYVMNINPTKTTTPFASIESVSAVKGEDEVLFSMNSVFRIAEISTTKEHERLIQVNLTLTNEDDKHLRDLTNRMRLENYPMEQPWFRLGFLVKQMGNADKAKEIFQILLDQIDTDKDKSTIYFELAAAHTDNRDNKEALALYAKHLIILRKQFSSDHIFFASTYHNIGQVYYNMSDYPKALEYYKKALEIRKKSLPSDDPALGCSYNNIAGIYEIMGDNERFREYAEKALAIEKRSSISNHPNLAKSYGNMGLVHYKTGNYQKAMEYYEKDLEIMKKSLPPTHPDIGMCYNNIAGVYQAMGNSRKALECMEKAHDIRKQSLPPNHPELGMSYNNIGYVYEQMGDYSKARSNYKLAVDIPEKSLPANHPQRLTAMVNLKRVNNR